MTCLFFGGPTSIDRSRQRPSNDCRIDWECCLGLFSSWIDPSKSTIFIQSQIPELAELSMYYMNLVSLARLERNPTVKTEIAQKGFGESIPTDFWFIRLRKQQILLPSRLIMFLLGQIRNQ